MEHISWLLILVAKISLKRRNKEVQYNELSDYAPTKNPDLAKQRQKQVMDKMVKHGYLTEEKAEQILQPK